MKQKPKPSNLGDAGQEVSKNQQKKVIAVFTSYPGIPFLQAKAVIPSATQRVIAMPDGRALTPLVEN